MWRHHHRIFVNRFHVVRETWWRKYDDEDSIWILFWCLKVFDLKPMTRAWMLLCKPMHRIVRTQTVGSENMLLECFEGSTTPPVSRWLPLVCTVAVTSHGHAVLEWTNRDTHTAVFRPPFEVVRWMPCTTQRTAPYLHYQRRLPYRRPTLCRRTRTLRPSCGKSVGLL